MYPALSQSGTQPPCQFQNIVQPIQQHLLSLGYAIPTSELGVGGSYTCGAAQDFMQCSGLGCVFEWVEHLGIDCDRTYTGWVFTPPCEAHMQDEEPDVVVERNGNGAPPQEAAMYAGAIAITALMVGGAYFFTRKR
jgi:hypothetical protein